MGYSSGSGKPSLVVDGIVFVVRETEERIRYTASYWEEKVEIPTQEEECHKQGSRPPWIVLAEDNLPDVYLIQEALDQEGLDCRLDTIGDGDEVLNFIDHLEANPHLRCPNLFVVDLNLPKRSGAEILSRLRRSGHCSEVPAIVISSSDAPRDLDLAKAMRVTLYFRKPSELKEFMKIGAHIRTVLNEHQSSKPPV